MFQPDKQFREILEIGISLTIEKDYDRLLEMLLQKSMEITSCDAGTLFLKEENSLILKFMHTISLHTCKGEHKEAIDSLPISLEEENVCAYSAIHKQVINIENIYDCANFDFSKLQKQDTITGYHTQSMLVIPLENSQGEISGVIQLINAQAKDKIIPFHKTLEFMLLFLASQAATSVSNFTGMFPNGQVITMNF